MSIPSDINIDGPRYDPTTYVNRAKHFFLLTNPLNLLASNAELERAKAIVQKYRNKESVPECKTVDDLWKAKYLYDSAFHPETGEKSILIGRMSAQVPMNTLITGCMMTFYKTTPTVIFWQWVNQTFNAVVNYTNRSGADPVPKEQLVKSYCFATGGALATALTFNRLVKNLNPLIGRLVPLIAVASANCINIPMMRSIELEQGTTIYDENNNILGQSKNAARTGITAVVLSRISMAFPSMLACPILMERLSRRGFFVKYPWAPAPVQTLFCGFVLIFSTPLGCAFFKQWASIDVSKLEKEVQEEIRKKNPEIKTVYYNKGL
ncbi:sideroflexin-1-3 [Condylostylus longicornis]|uniref:sideroflexin-1-3 n=1 Tax=Condylostylus longicornis TaxID=2530218 RepID=UPI00244DC65C|nr:sideroflexin-1-3 [Condylostylus longicornis]